MDYTLQLDRENKTVIATARGDWVSEVDNAMVSEIMEIVESDNADNVLLDIRELHYDLSIVKIYERARELREQRHALAKASTKVAIVYSSNNPKLKEDMRFFETTARNRGLPYRVFTDIDEAREWLFEL